MPLPEITPVILCKNYFFIKNGLADIFSQSCCVPLPFLLKDDCHAAINKVREKLFPLPLSFSYMGFATEQAVQQRAINRACLDGSYPHWDKMLKSTILIV